MSQETTFDEVYNYACEHLTQSIANAQNNEELLAELTSPIPLNYQIVTPPNKRSKKYVIDLALNNVHITFNRCTINYYTQLKYGAATLHKGIVNLNQLYKIIKAVGDMIANSTSPHMKPFRDSRQNEFQLFGQKTIPYPDVLIFFSSGYTSNSQKPLVKKEDSAYFNLEVTQKLSLAGTSYNVCYVCTVEPAFETETVLRLKQVECNPSAKKINIIFEPAKYSIEKGFIAEAEEYAAIAPKPKASSKIKQPVVNDSDIEEEVVRKPESRSRLRSAVEDNPKVVPKSKSKKVNSDSEEELAKQVSKKVVVVQSESEEEYVQPKSTKTKKVVVHSESEEEQVRPKSSKTKKVVVVQSESEEEHVQPKSTKTKKVDKASREDLVADKRTVLAERPEKKTTKTRPAKESDSEEDVKTIPVRRNK